jgi:putative adhesin
MREVRVTGTLKVRPRIAQACRINMLRTKRGPLPPVIALLALLAAVAASFGQARADQSVQTPTAPIVVVRSTSGVVTILRGDDGDVRVSGGSATATQFTVSRENLVRMVLPAGAGLPSRRFTLPGVTEGAPGVRIDNPGGDITVYVPQHVGAVLVKAAAGDVSLTGTRGPYVIIAPQGNVDVNRVFGFGNVRTTAGHVNLTGVGGNLHVETTFGTVTGQMMFPERAEIHSQGGDIDWQIARLGGGPYRFASDAGNVHVGIDGNVAANIDAQSTQGTVTNRFGRVANVRFHSAHAVSMMLGGGGPQITAASTSGTVDVGPRRP